MRSARIAVVSGIAAAALAVGGAAIADAAPAAPAPAQHAVAAVTHAAPVRAAQAAKQVARKTVSKSATWRDYRVTAHSLYVRSGPGTNYRAVSVLHNGQRVVATTKTVNGFREISAGHWVGAKYLAAVGK